MAYTKYSLTPADNNAAPPNGAPEGMLPSAVNDTMRDMMAQIRDVGDGIRGGTYTMTAPVITGGSVTGVTSVSTSGNLTFTGTSNRILGDFSNATIASRAAFQSSTTNGNTGVFFIPNGTAVNANIQVVNNSTPTNASITQVVVNATESSLRASITGTGTYLPLTMYTNASERLRIDTSGNVGIGTSSPSQKLDVVGNIISSQSITIGSGGLYQAGSIYADASWGMIFRSKTASGGGQGAEFMFASSTGTERMRIDSGGNLLVGTTSSNARLTVNGVNTSSTDNSFVARKSDSTVVLQVRNDGYVFLPPTYNLTTGNAANLFINTDGSLLRSTSSLKYKSNVKDAVHGLAEVMQLRPVTYKGINDGETIFGGLIAEEVDAVGLTEFVQYAEDGSPDALAYGQMVSLALKAIQELKAELDSVKAELQTLKGN